MQFRKKKTSAFAEGQGWMKNENRVLEPIWSNKPILPISLIDILYNHGEEEMDVDDDKEFEGLDSDAFCDDDDDEN